MEARYSGQCARCGAAIEPGDEITRDKDRFRQYAHTRCASVTEGAATPARWLLSWEELHSGSWHNQERRYVRECDARRNERMMLQAAASALAWSARSQFGEVPEPHESYRAIQLKAI